MEKQGRPRKNNKTRLHYTFCIDQDLLYELQGKVTKKKIISKSYSASDWINDAIAEKLKIKLPDK
jgi:hypothetical protein